MSPARSFALSLGHLRLDAGRERARAFQELANLAAEFRLDGVDALAGVQHAKAELVAERLVLLEELALVGAEAVVDVVPELHVHAGFPEFHATRLQHAADGSVSTRADQADYEKLLEDLNLQRHLIKGNWVWDLPDLDLRGNPAKRVVGYLVNDWQLSGLFTGGSGNRYDLNNFNYQGGIGNQNLTGSPDYGARIVLTGDPGKGCSSNQYSQFNTSAVTSPTYNSVGLESGRNYMVGCPNYTTDLAIARNIRLGGGRQIQLRLDAYNAFKVAIITNRQNQIQYNSPTDLTIRNPQYVVNQGDTTLAPGAVGTVLSATRLQPRNAGYGAATGWSGSGINNNYLRFIQATIRVSF